MTIATLPLRLPYPGLRAFEPDDLPLPGRRASAAAHPFVRFASAVGGTVGIAHAVHDQAGLGAEEVRADHVVDGDQLPQRCPRHRVLPCR